MTTNYTEEFSKMTKEDWLERIRRDGLKDDALLVELDKDILLNPFYVREDSVDALKALDNKSAKVTDRLSNLIQQHNAMDEGAEDELAGN